MKSFKSYIAEVFDKPYPYKWHSFTATKGQGSFQDATGARIFFNIEVDNDVPGPFQVNGYYYLTFGAKINDRGGLSYANTDSKDGFKVMSTILKMLFEYVNEYHDEIYAIQFEGAKQEYRRTGGSMVPNERLPTGKGKLYSRMIKKYLPSSWTVEEEEGSSDIEFTIYNNNFDLSKLENTEEEP